MPTFGQIKQTVSRKLQNANLTSVSALNVGDAINDAIRFWRYRPFWFNQASVQLTLASGVQVISGLPSDFLFENPENGFVIPDVNCFYTLDKKPNFDFDNERFAQDVGRPYCYTYRRGQYEIYPMTDKSYSMNVYYTKDYTVLSADGDSNDFTNHADQLVVYEALSRLFGEDRMDAESGNNYASKAEREYSNLRMRTGKQQATGRLSVETIL